MLMNLQNAYYLNLGLPQQEGRQKNRWAYTMVKLDDCDSEGGFFFMAV